ncbi:uncharacterized protein LOC120836462 [Ixodes scapularis]|uniref:uncharacterized protein LOC120836462 n=1 Tax=Ixodes scapularis TaxID=6945 RepID=UPI001A9E81FB|nr:uncharacterized protein LOC120836462 [Ixodes scapularis]
MTSNLTSTMTLSNFVQAASHLHLLKSTTVIAALGLISASAVTSPVKHLQRELPQHFIFSGRGDCQTNMSLNFCWLFLQHYTLLGGCYSAPPVLTLGGSPIPRVSHTKLLGVTLDDKLDFHRHICDVASKARRTLGFVTHLSRDLPPEAFRNLYTALVLPQLEFCCAIWGPLQQSRQNALASIQRRAAFTFYRRSAPRSSLLSYRDVSTDSLLRNANWRSLQHRRDVASIRLFCRVMSADDMDCPNIPRLNRRRGRLQPVLARTLRHRRTCLLRAAELWLALPPELTAVIPKDRDSIKELCQLISRKDGWHL